MLIFRTTNRGYTSKIYGDGITARSVKADDIVLLTDYQGNITIKIAYYDIQDNFLGLYNFTNLAPGSVYGAYTMSHDAAYLAYLHTIPSAVIANRGLLKFSFQFIDGNGVIKNSPIFTENIIDSVYTIDSDVQPTIVLDNRYWPIASTTQVGLVKVDGTTITADEDGTIHSAGGSGDITELKGDIDAHTANLLNPTITNATLKQTITNQGIIAGGIISNAELQGAIQADAAEINNATLNDAELSGTTTAGDIVSNGGKLEGFKFSGVIDKTAEVPTMGTSAKSVATKGYADNILKDAKDYADSISHGATAYVYSDEAALYNRMTVNRGEGSEGQYEYSIAEIKDANDNVIDLETLNLGTNFLFETSDDGSRWLAKKVFFSSEVLDTTAPATKAMFFKLYDNDTDNYVSKTEFNTKVGDLQGQITATDTKIDNVNNNLSAITGELTTNLEAETNNREAADTAINATLDNLTKVVPTDIKGDGNKIYLVHDGTKLTPQTDVEFKTVNGTSIIGSGNIPVSGSATTVVTIDAPATATSGNLTASQLATLQEDKGNLLEFNNEIYYLNDDEHVNGLLVYTHSGYNEGVSGMKKYISITIATAAWTLVIEDSSDKLDKVDTITTYTQAYVKTASGSQTMIDIAENVKTNSIPYRTSNGTIKATDPQEDDDAATKLYVDRYIKPSNIYADDNLLDICNAADDTLASIPFKTINGISLFGESGDIEVEAPTFISTFNISSKNITQAINGVYRTNLSNSNLVTFLRKQEGTLTTTINLLETPKFTWDITLLPAQYLQKKSSGTTYAFVGSTIVPEDLSAYGGNATANLVILRCEALYYNDVVYSYYLTIIPIEASGGTVIEKTCDNNGTFAADLTADEFTQLSTNAASLKLTYNYLNTLPITLYLSNPVVGTLDGTTTTIVYQFPVPLTVDGVWMAVINSGDLTKIDLTHKVQDTTPAYGSDGGYTAISNYPLLGLVHDEADVATLLTPTAFEFGNLYYKTDTTSWQWSGNTDHIGDNYITATIMSLNGATQTSIAGTAFEAMLMMTQTDGSYKYYTSIVNIGNDNVSGSEGLFTVYDTTTHKPIYITFTIKANSSTTLTVDTFTAYQDGAAATDAVLPLVYGIKLFRL